MNENINLDISKNAMQNYSIHTFTIRKKLLGGSYDLIKLGLDKLSDDKYPEKACKKKKNMTLTHYFDIARHYGFNDINIAKIRSPKQEKCQYYLDIKVNPWKLFHKETYPFLYIATKEDLIKSLKLIESLLVDIELSESLIHDFYLKRVDFCTNIDLGSSERTDEYMKLLRKGAYPYKFKRLEEYSEVQKRWIPTKNSFTVVSKNIQFAVYDKYKQLKEEAHKYTFEEIESAKGKIRIELRLERDVVNRKEKKYDLDDAFDFVSFASKIASEDIPRYVKMVYGSGKFVTYKEATSIIQNAKYRDTTKELLMEILHMVKKTHSLQEFKENTTKKEYSKCMRLFNDLGISPITLDKRANSKEFLSLLVYVEAACCNQPVLYY